MAVSLVTSALLTGTASAKDNSGPLSFPEPGVICDPAGPICYDRRGLSLGITRATYGRKAEERVRRELGGRPAPKEFRLSTGEVCSVPRGTCWHDGWSKKEVSQRLTRQLFGAAGPAAIKDGSCSLSRANRSIFNGPCDLRSESRQGVTRYVVSLEDGRRYSFTNRNGRYELSDSSGSWPVRIENRGRSGLFRWSDYTLVASRNGGAGSGSGSGSSSNNAGGAALGAALGSLLQGLFQPAMVAPGGSGGDGYSSGYGSPAGYGNPAGYGGGMAMASPPATIVFPSPGSCVTYGGQAESFRLQSYRGQWLQVQAVDRGIAVITPSGRSLPSAYGNGQWTLPEGGTYAVNLEYPPAEGMAVRFCLR